MQRVVLLVCVGALLGASLSYAAETNPASRTQAGPEERRFRRRVKPVLPPPSLSPSIEDQTTPPPVAPLPPAASFLVRRFLVEGSRLIPPQDIRRLVAPYEGRTVTIAELKALTDSMTHWLRGRGYVTSRAILPPQEVSEGVVRVQIIEGRIGAIRVEGATHSRPAGLMARMKSRPGVVLHYRTLQQDLLRLGANPDRRVTAVLVPGQSAGTTDVVLRVEEQAPGHLLYLAHNGGTTFTGRWRQGFILGHNNLTGRDDQLVLRGEFSEGAHFIGTGANYLVPLGPSGRTLSIEASRAMVELQRHFEDRDVEGTATVLGFVVAQPLFQTAQWDAEWATGFDAKRVRSQELGVVQGKDDLRILRVGPNLVEQDAWGRSIVTTEVEVGFSELLGASDKVDTAASRAQTGGQFTRFVMAFGRLQRLWRGVQVLVRGIWQWTKHRLPPSEMLSLGGADTIRGYPEGEFLGDVGLAGTVEIRLPLAPPAAQRGPPLMSLAGFLDFGSGHVRKLLVGEDEERRLVGIGFGVRWAIERSMNGQLDVGFPIGDESTEGNFPRLHFSATLGF